jgi:parvulin-like peptidyl-prolyl isomerase
MWTWGRKLLGSPSVHFAVLGCVLFGLSTGLQRLEVLEARSPEREPIEITAEKLDGLERQFQRSWGREPTQPELRALIQDHVDDEILYREARALALGFEDASVRRRLVQKMRALSDRLESDEELYQQALALGLDDDIVIRRLLVEKMRVLLRGLAPASVEEQDLVAYRERHPERFEKPPQVSFRHVYVSEEGTAAGDRAMAIARALAPLTPDDPAVAELSDLFALGLQLRGQSEERVRARFGEGFSEAVFALEPGQWSQPIQSPYGYHLVWVDKKLPRRQASPEEVQSALAVSLLKERAAHQLQREMDRLRERYEIRLEGVDVELAGAESGSAGSSR